MLLYFVVELPSREAGKGEEGEEFLRNHFKIFLFCHFHLYCPLQQRFLFGIEAPARTHFPLSPSSKIEQGQSVGRHGNGCLNAELTSTVIPVSCTDFFSSFCRMLVESSL